VFYVDIYVDEEEPMIEPLWKDRLKKRLDRASRVIQKYADIRFTVGSFGVWKSDNNENDFSRSLREFEQEVTPRFNRIAIAFSSQYKFHRGRSHLGGTHGPMRPHILIRESNPQVTETDRIEVLAHELGHFLGAVHCSDLTSVMRPVITKHAPLHGKRPITFDPLNAQILEIVAVEVSYGDVRRFNNMSESAKRKLRDIYARAHEQMPKDRAAAAFLQMIDSSPKRKR